jgi:hypothetical protein
MRHSLLVPVLCLSLAGCSPCGYDTGIVAGQVSDAADGLAIDGGTVQLIPTSGETLQVAIFGSGRFEASVPAGTYTVVAYDSDDACYSLETPVTVEPCDDLELALEIVDCF